MAAPGARTTTARRLLALALALAIAAAAWGLPAAQPGGDAGIAATLAASNGKLKLGNSRADSAILAASGLAPGKRAEGEVRVTNRGPGTAHVWLGHRTKGRRGPGGGRLMDVLKLRIERSAGGGTRRLHAGRLSRLRKLRIGRWRPGGGGRFRFVVSFPAAAPVASPSGGDNRYQGAKTSIRFIWRAKLAR
jgi:hypothetical protein